MKKIEKVHKVKNVITGETFLSEHGLQKEIEGKRFIGVWKENDPAKRVVWINQDSVKKVNY